MSVVHIREKSYFGETFRVQSSRLLSCTKKMITGSSENASFMKMLKSSLILGFERKKKETRQTWTMFSELKLQWTQSYRFWVKEKKRSLGTQNFHFQA